MMWAMGPSVTSSPGVNAVSVKVPSLSPSTETSLSSSGSPCMPEGSHRAAMGEEKTMG